MALTRRTLLKGAGTVAGLQLVGPVLGRAAYADTDPQWAARRRLVVVNLVGGNDGLNTVVPRTGPRRAVYEQVRPSIQLAPGSLHPLDAGADDGSLGLHTGLATVHSLYQAGRVAVVQGVDYPDHSYSHFTSMDIWHAGIPTGSSDSGWIGRHLDRVGVRSDELRAVGIGGELPPALRGRTTSGVQIASLDATHFSDTGTAVGTARHAAFAGFDQHPAEEPFRSAYGEICAGVVRLDAATRGLVAPAPGGLADQLMTARTLLTADLGVEVVFVSTNGGYDTHASQLPVHANQLTDLDQAIEAFFLGTKGGVAVTDATGAPIGPLPSPLAEQTLLMTFSEFGRRIGENASGTDHGAAAPMLLVGPPQPPAGSGTVRLVPGLHCDHPDVGTTTLPADNLAMTTDMRSVYQAVLTRWLDDPTGPSPDEGDPQFVLSGPNLDTDGSLTGLFAPA